MPGTYPLAEFVSLIITDNPTDLFDPLNRCPPLPIFQSKTRAFRFLYIADRVQKRRRSQSYNLSSGELKKTPKRMLFITC